MKVRVGMELAQGKDLSATLNPGHFTKNLKPLPAPPELRAGRKDPLSMASAKVGRVVLARRGLSTRYPRPFGADCLKYQGAPWE